MRSQRRVDSLGAAVHKDVRVQADHPRRSLWQLLSSSFAAWQSHEGPRLSAALAFYTTLSLAPLLVILVNIVALVFGSDAAHGQIAAQAQSILGAEGARTVQTVLQHAQAGRAGIVSSLVSLLVIFFGASAVFAELRDALNKLWDVQQDQSNGWLALIKSRIVAIGMVLSIGFLILLLFLVSAALETLSEYRQEWLPLPEFAINLLNFVFSFAIVVLLVALIFRYVPDRKVRWNKIWVGAIATAFLFTIGKQLIGLYIGKAAVGSAYGAAGSLVALIVWVYYSSMSFYLGAEFTRALSPGKQLLEGAQS